MRASVRAVVVVVVAREVVELARVLEVVELGPSKARRRKLACSGARRPLRCPRCPRCPRCGVSLV